MLNSLRLPCYLLLIISSVYYVHGELTAVPENVAVLESSAGTTVILTCTAAASPLARVFWTEFANSPTGLILSDNKNINPSHPNAARYAIVGGPLDYHLQITDATRADAGRYLCQDINGVPPGRNQGSAELIVMDDDPKCTDISTITGVVVEDRFYSQECDVKYRGNFPPNMTWTGPGQYQNDNSVTGTDVWSRVSFTALRELEGGQFVCMTRFVVPANLPPDAATNTPSYQFEFTGSVLIVNWGPKDLDTFPQQSMYEVGDVITCTSDARPEPTYRWTNLRTLETEDPSPTYTIPPELLGTQQNMRCNVVSLIEGTLYSADTFLDVTVPAPTTPTTPGTTTPTTPAPADSPCLDLTGQWTSTNPNANLCIEVDSKGNVLSLLRNGTDTFFVTGTGKTVYNDYKHIGLTGIWPSSAFFGVGGFVGECHRCFGTEIILMSGLARNKAHSQACGVSEGTRLSNVYAFTRFGPPCRNPEAKVLRPSETHIKHFGIRPENIIL